MFTKHVQIKDQELLAFIDTGSQCSMICKSVADNLLKERQPCTLVIKGICGGERMLQEVVETAVNIDGIDMLAKLYVVNDDMFNEDLLLGQDIFKSQHVKATIDEGSCKFGKLAKAENELDIDIVTGDNVTKEVRNQVREMVTKYRDVFAKDLTEIGNTDLVTLKIDLNTTEPIAQPPRRVPYPKRQVVVDLVNELLSKDIIQPSESEYVSPIQLVKKPDGSDQFCVDYRRINSHMRREVFPMPNIEERLQDAKEYKLFTTLDLNSGYYQVPVEKDNINYTAFITPDGVYEFKRMPFGLQNAPIVFQRLMAKLRDMVQPGDMIHYMDDILIGSNDEETGFRKLERVLQAMRKANLTLNPKKCKFFSNEISFLGHRLTAEGIIPGVIKTKAITEFKTPTNLTELRRFLGLSGYFRKFVPAYAIIT